MKYIIGNWKMNLSLGETQKLVSGILEFLKKQDSEHQLSKYFMVAPSYPFLFPLQHKIKKDASLLSLVAQDVSSHAKGAFTGEVSANQLKEMSIHGTLIGHSERRLYHHETEEILLQKIQNVFASKLIPIICLGESLEVRRAQQTLSYVTTQLHALCAPLKGHFFEQDQGVSASPFLIAYEPLWAIGTGITPTPTEIEEVHSALHQTLNSLFPQYFVPVIYGGSVTQENAREILSLPSVNGALIGGASLKLPSFVEILREALSQKS